jgi:UDP-glucose 4-epimerase
VRRSLVTGAAGFIGSHVARQCLALGHQVVAVDDLSGGFKENLPSQAEFRELSVTDVASVDLLFEEFKFDFVYHLAAYAAEGLSHFIRRFNYTNNIIGSVNLINAGIEHDVRRFVFTSSIAVYGTNQVPMSEDLVPMPEDPYGIAKYAVELDLRAARELFGLEYTIFRPHNVYGEHQNIADRYRNVIGIFMNRVMQGKPMTIFGDGSQSRAFSHIDDVAPIIAACVDSPAAVDEVFNIGADEPTNVNELARLVAASFEVDALIEHLPPRNEVLHAFATHEKVHETFGIANSVPLDVGLRRMAEWAREHGPRPAPVFDGIEVHKNLPAAWLSNVADSNA